MLDIIKKVLPHAVRMGDAYYPIYTDFRFFLRLQEVFEEGIKDGTEIDFMFQGTPPRDRVKAIDALIEFMSPPEVLPRQTAGKKSDKIIDYRIDSDYIYSAFMQMYHIDLFEVELHWYKFCALMKNLSGTELNNITKYRTWENTSGEHTDYTRFMQDMRTAWELPHETEPDEDLIQFENELYGE